MHRTWCWSPSRRAAARAAAAVALAAAAASPLVAPTAAAATVLLRSVTVEVLAEGRVREVTALRVRMDDPADVAAWSDYGVYLDDHRELTRLEGRVVGADGRRVPVRRRHRDEVAFSHGSFHSSARLLALEVPSLRPGSVFELETTVEIVPYYPAGSVLLVDEDPVEELRVEVRGGGPATRWTLEGEREGIAGRTLAGGDVVVTGTALAAADDPEADTVWLHYAWGADGTWAGVGRWYDGLLAGLERAAEPVRVRARGLIVDDRRATLEALARFVQEEVRYVAVEVGIGGYRPSAPREVLARRWGDCKDKSLLLVDLLAEAGIPALPALTTAGGGRVDPSFPSPTQFDHLIVAVPAAAVGAGEGDAVAGGYLFVDPTQPRGGASWLSPAVQGQDALVVLADGGELVRLPVVAEAEGTTLVVNVRVDPSGTGVGGASFRLRGGLALGLLGEAEDGGADRVDAGLRAIFGRLLPGVELGSVGWTRPDGGIFAVDLSGAVKMPGLVQGLAPGAGGRPSSILPALRATPEPRSTAGRSTPLDADPGRHRTVWHVALPDGCTPPEEADLKVSNAAGSFRQTVRHTSSGFTLERDAILLHRWYEGELLAALEELGLTEGRALRRRLRFACGAAAEGADPEAADDPA